jgi:lipoate---protein ligase
MFCITLETNDPSFNLAIEEVLLKSRKEDFLILGINSPCLVIGKHQLAHREVNTKFVTENNIPVIRRISGGGTVYHDTGNLNFTFISQSESGRQIDFRKYTGPVIDFLASKGVNAVFEGKNDLKVNGLKISGNAEHVYRNRVLHHGTLLFSSSLDILRSSIRKDTSCYKSRAVESNPSSITNLNDLMKSISDISLFRSEMMDYFLKNTPMARKYYPDQKEIEEAKVLAAEKYRTWEWNYAYGPEYRFSNTIEYHGEYVDCRFYVQEGIIRECELTGSHIPSGIENKLVGCRHMVNEIKEVLIKENLSDLSIFDLF